MTCAADAPVIFEKCACALREPARRVTAQRMAVIESLATADDHADPAVERRAHFVKHRIDWAEDAQARRDRRQAEAGRVFVAEGPPGKARGAHDRRSRSRLIGGGMNSVVRSRIGLRDGDAPLKP